MLHGDPSAIAIPIRYFIAQPFIVKGASESEYKKLPKDEKRIVDVIRSKNISEDDILDNMNDFNRAKSELKNAQKFLDNLNWDACLASVNKTESLISKIKIFDTRSLLAELEKIKKEIGTNRGAG